MPAGKEPPEVDERVPDRRLLPVHDRGELGRCSTSEQRVDQLVVAVDDPGLSHRWNAIAQPRRDTVDVRDVPGSVLRELSEPSVDLALEVTVRAPEPDQPVRLPVDLGQRSEAVDELEPDLS